MDLLTSSVPTLPSDSDLVARIRRGDRNAFGLVVERYQSLVCALAYSACGNTSQSEDIAQEVFTSAWGHMGELREPDRLKSWLCGIARHSAVQAHRRSRREPAQTGAELSGEELTTEAPPSEQAMRREEEMLLWRGLARLPEGYREVMVLYYREHRSIEHVASALDLTEENVRQRLSRGRRALHEEVNAMLEGSLSASAPGPRFTSAVMGALPASTIGAAASGGSVFKGGALAKIGLTGAGGVISWMGGLLMPVLGMVIQIGHAETPQERKGIVKMWMTLWAGCAVFVAGVYALSMGANVYGQDGGHKRAVVLIVAVSAYTIAFGVFIWRCMTGREPVMNMRGRDASKAAVREFRTQAQFLGLPWVHVQFGEKEDGPLPAARGWIAIGRVAHGGLFACGVLAVAPISVGMLSVGLLSSGCVALGVLSVGSFALGAYALGGVAAGYLAWGGCALGWHAAMGGAVWARDYAIGGRWATIAAHANGPIAYRAIDGMFFFRHSVAIFTMGLAAAWTPFFVSLVRRRRS